MFRRIKQVHFIGIGGAGMSGIAEVLLTLGYRVTGSDLRLSPVTDALQQGGATVFGKHDAANVECADVVVRSSAIGSSNPELEGALARRIPVISRAEMLAELARLKYTVAVAGTHGKTTTTSMVASILERGGFDPTFVIGGKVNAAGLNARLGSGEFIVLEADESDGSFLMLSPTIAIVTNIEADHLDHYSGLDEIEDAFVEFSNKVPFYGLVVVPAVARDQSSDAGTSRFIERINRPVVTFGESPAAQVRVIDWRPDGLGSRFRLGYSGGRTIECALRVPGRHNAMNAAAAFAATFEIGVSGEVIAAGLEEFAGVERRFQVKATEPFTVVDDYAHHPTEVRATIAAARTGGFRRIVVAFQPHRHTRTARLFEDFAHAFDDADLVVMTDIYPAGEMPIEGVSAEALVDRMRSRGREDVFYFPNLDEVESFVRRRVAPGDAVLVLGAGNITTLSDALAVGVPVGNGD
jgi:UDP-N-acetylmuramate--alanine ligase